MNLEQDIKDFHEKFGNDYKGKPRQLPLDLQDFRNRFLFEELNEYIEAVEDGDLAKQFDALVDLVYVAMGTAYLQGFPFNAGWMLVHAANMKKVRAVTEADSKRASTYDVVKPKDWVAPDLNELLS